MKHLCKLFSFLDAVSIVLISPQIWLIVKNWETISNPILPTKTILTLLVYPMLFLTATGFFQYKRWACMVYYFQFPLRLLTWVFSFGMLTYFSQFSESATLAEWLFRFVFMLEFIRLYLTIQLHRKVL